jgi:ribosomal 30S subunit maturation factor RimM
VADLVGKNVVDEKRGLLGKVASVLETGKNHCLEIQPEKGESYLIPMTDDVVLGIGSEVKVKLLPGLHPDETEEV